VTRLLSEKEGFRLIKDKKRKDAKPQQEGKGRRRRPKKKAKEGPSRVATRQ
jgi:hypothetical protein